MPMRTIRQFALQLTPSSAFGAFAAALAIGAAAIVTAGPTWLVFGPVVVYGGMLFYAQRKLFVALNATLKDSPYFLGFILTLISLAVLLSAYSALVGSDPLEATGLVQSVGDALLPTVIGLIARQALLSLDSGEISRDAAFNKMVATIREDAKTFYEQQQLLVTLVGEFSRTREEMFAVEAQAHQRYVTSLTAASSSLSDLQQAWPANLMQLGSAVADAALAFRGAAEDSARMLAEVRNATQSAVSSGSDVVTAAAEEMAKALTANRATLAREMEQTTAVLSRTSSEVENEVSQLRSILHQYPEAIRELAGAVQGVSHATGELSSGFTALSRHASAMASSFNEAMVASAEATTAAHTSILASRDSAEASLRTATEGSLSLVAKVGEQARASLDDMRAVDEIVGEVVRVLRQRLTALEAAGVAVNRGHGAVGVGSADRQASA